MHAHNQPDSWRRARIQPANFSMRSSAHAPWCVPTVLMDMRARNTASQRSKWACQSRRERVNNYFHQLASNCHFFISPCFFSPPASVATIPFTHSFHALSPCLCINCVTVGIQLMGAAISFPFLALGPLILSTQSLFIVSMLVNTNTNTNTSNSNY